MNASDRCIQLIKEFEGFEALPYKCAAGKLTVGYGHLIRSGEVFPVTGLTEAEATELLCKDLKDCEACVDAYVDAPLESYQFDALCSFVFNLGCQRLKTSTLLKKLNKEDYKGATAEFDRWVMAGGKKLNGLVRRRAAERALFEGKA